MNPAIQKNDMGELQLPDSIKALQRAIPAVIVDFLRQHANVALVFECNPQSNSIQVGIKKMYSQDVQRTATESKHALTEAEKSGYSEEDAMNDFMEAQKEIAAQMKTNTS